MKSNQTENATAPRASSQLNRTGIMLNPEMSAELIVGAEQASASPREDTQMADRASYLTQLSPIGSLPAIVGGTKPEQLADGSTSILLDKLGERLAFERQGTRLYEAFLQKLDVLRADAPSGPTSEELRHICDEELEHFRILQRTIAELGGDATVQTPSADVAGVLSQGVLQIVSDPRTTIAQSLQALLTAELADNDGWEMLADLAGELGDSELVEKCEKAFTEEQEHLDHVRAWLSQMTLEQALNESPVEKSNGSLREGSEEPGTKSSRARRSSAKKAGKRRKK
jgi:rubrerythrin